MVDVSRDDDETRHTPTADGQLSAPEPPPAQRTRDDTTVEDHDEDGDGGDIWEDIEVERAAPGSSDDDDDDDDDSDSDDEEMLEWMEQEEAGLYPGTDELDVFPSVPYVYPRMNYRGAKNVHTVKDGEFGLVRVPLTSTTG
jgi:hypothetical protein